MKVVKYDGTKTYMFPSGTLATPEAVAAQFPAINYFTHIIETDGEVLFSCQNLSAMRQFHKIDPDLTEEEAIAAIEEIVNTPPEEPGPSAEERIAAALEFQAMSSLPDME